MKHVMGCCPPVTSSLAFLLTWKLASLSSCTGLSCGVLCLWCAMASNGIPAWPPPLHPIPWCSRVTGIWHGPQERGVPGIPSSLWMWLVLYGGRGMWTEGNERRALRLVWGQQITALSGRLWRGSRICLCCSNERYALYKPQFSLKGRTSFMGNCKTLMYCR